MSIRGPNAELPHSPRLGSGSRRRFTATALDYLSMQLVNRIDGDICEVGVIKKMM